jgi:hypothetical protein
MDKLEKLTIAQLREAQGDDASTRMILCGYIQEKLKRGCNLDQAISPLAIGHDSVFSQVSYTDAEMHRLTLLLQSLNLAEVYGLKTNADV